MTTRRIVLAAVTLLAVGVGGGVAAHHTLAPQDAARHAAARQDADMQRQLVAAERTLAAVVAPTGLTRVAATSAGCTTTLRRICLVSQQDPATVSRQVGTWLGGTPVQYSSSPLRHSINGHLGATRLIGVVGPLRDAKRVVVGSAILLYVSDPGV